MKSFFYTTVILWILCGLKDTEEAKPQTASIIAGKPAELGQFPWHVLLKLDPEDELLCGGSLIADKWVLTAAHCVIGAESIILIFGTIDLHGSGVNMTSTKMFPHPTFDIITRFDDIALIELPTPVDFSDNIRAIDLVTSDEAAHNTFMDVEVLVSGYGPLEDGAKFSPWLLWGSEKIVNNSVCIEPLGPMTDNEMCSIGFYNDSQHPCSGDSGGALVWKNEANKTIQIGIIIYEKMIECSKFPTVYTRVSSYLDFIQNITGLSVN